MEAMQERDSPPLAERRRVAYDRFGPWTYRVSDASEMPPEFDPWYAELEGSALIVKLPVQDERRNLKPTDALYERVLAVGASGIVSLSLASGGVERLDIPFGDIAAIRLVHDLLHGEFRIDLANGDSAEVVFNTVSADIFESFIDETRARLLQAPASRRFSPKERGPEPLESDTLAQMLIGALRRRETGLALLAYQPPCVLKSRDEGGRRGLIGIVARLLPWRIDGCILAGTESELVAVVRGSGSPHISPRRGYRYEIAYLPSGSLKEAEVEPRSLANGALVYGLHLVAPGHDYELLFERDQSDALADLGPA
jgi:hypothetical protein